MKLLTVIVQTTVQQEVISILRGLEMVSGYSFSQVDGHGVQAEQDKYLSAKDRLLGQIPRVRVDILLEDDAVEPVLQALRAEHTHLGQGVYWLTAVEQGGHLQCVTE